MVAFVIGPAASPQMIVPEFKQLKRVLTPRFWISNLKMGILGHEFRNPDRQTVTPLQHFCPHDPPYLQCITMP